MVGITRSVSRSVGPKSFTPHSFIQTLYYCIFIHYFLSARLLHARLLAFSPLKMWRVGQMLMTFSRTCSICSCVDFSGRASSSLRSVISFSLLLHWTFLYFRLKPILPFCMSSRMLNSLFLQKRNLKTAGLIIFFRRLSEFWFFSFAFALQPLFPEWCVLANIWYGALSPFFGL